jgi:thioredoxin 1
MSPDVLVRLAIAASLIVLGLSVYWAWNHWQLHRRSQPAAARLLGLENARPGVPAILYFTTPDCAPCKTTQQPALQRLQARLGEAVQVIQVDASAQPALADYWGVLSVPTTFVIDAHGRPRSVNNGLASTDKLQRQLDALKHEPLAAAGLRPEPAARLAEP